MAQETEHRDRGRFWIVLAGVLIVLVFLYFYPPVESYVRAAVPRIHSHNAIIWFASLVGVIAYVVGHWASFRRHIFRGGSDLDVETLVYDTLQVAILVAVIFCAGGTLQVVEMLGEGLVGPGPVLGSGLGEKLLAIVLLVVLTIAFYLLHLVVRMFRSGDWTPPRPPPRRSPGGS